MPTKGSVLVLQFGPVAKSYFATSYPHRILDADPNDRRDYLCENMPMSLSKFLREFKRVEQLPGEKPRYIMNLATFAPLGSPDWNGATTKDPPGNLWYVYFWMDRADHEWNVDKTALPPGRLGLLASEFRSGSLSHVAFGPTNWQYQWTALPFLCERDCLKHIKGAVPSKGITKWIGGRLRGVTFGPDGSYIVFRGDVFDWDGAFPVELAEALLKGHDKSWSINNCVLNPRNPNEYFLAFNEADDLLRVYYAVHQDFASKFENIIEEWARKKGFSGKYETFPKKLTEAECQHDLAPLNVPWSSSRARSPLYEGHQPSTSNYPSTAVLPQRLGRRATIPHEVVMSIDTGYGSVQQQPPTIIQSYPQNHYVNGGMSAPPLNMGPNRVSSPIELQGNIPTQQYPPYGPPVIHPSHEYRPAPAMTPVHYVPVYYPTGAAPPPESAKKQGWGKRISKALAGDDSNGKLRKS